MKNVKDSANFIWSIVDRLRGDYNKAITVKLYFHYPFLAFGMRFREIVGKDVLIKFEQLKTTNIEMSNL